MSEEKIHLGGCHCKKVRYEVKIDLTKPAIVCNCSICQRTGSMLQFVPKDDFKLLSGDEVLTDYQFNKHQIHHLFCSVCGIRSFAQGLAPDGSDMRAINVRCLDDVEARDLPTMFYDGKST
jgi:hypothetical protein